MKANSKFFIFFIILLACFIHSGQLFAANANQKGNPQAHQLKTGQIRHDNSENNSDVFSNNGNPLQIAHYRLVKSAHFLKIFFIDLFSTVILLRYLKNNRKRIFSSYTRKLKLLLYPNHVFW
ncbi:hypothetical protein [Mucilaginibacter sp. UYCu711]|uniref:hypothetical protein n=1 Tax=Mucilaginibacter sp. UYCu711 TaxID=3156339 RepID=UPI003D1E71F7